MSENLPEKLARELVRVTQVRENYRRLQSEPNVIVAPQIALMDQAIENGCKAAGSPDIEGQISAIQALADWEE